MPSINSDAHTYLVPEDGLEEVLRGWSSKAQLYAALAGIEDDWADVRWSPLEIRQRANRVLYAELVKLLNAWPKRMTDWTNALPAASRQMRRMSLNPDPGTDWVTSAVRHGWPPDGFVVNERSRVPDQVMATTLKWTIDQIEKIRKDALKVEKESLKNAAKQEINALISVGQQRVLQSSEGTRPTGQDIRALRRSGAPWTQLATVAEFLSGVDRSNLMDFARRHLLPDNDVRWRLFHLGTLGVLLKSLRGNGWTLTSERPLSGTASRGPCYIATSPEGEAWDIWFEASGIWEYYGASSPYSDLMAGAFEGTADPVGADLAIIREGVAAHLFECKFGGASEVRRKGYHQVTTYVTEAVENLTPKAQGFVVGPDNVIMQSAKIVLDNSPINVVGPRHLADFLPTSLPTDSSRHT
ncbi:hypothetical protein [Streptomyces albidoflavus]|uniref:hypothetical protein n=1 Tax=Streptomyces albidoflavus TaxID=1886 RepID=UPI0033ADCA7C